MVDQSRMIYHASSNDFPCSGVCSLGLQKQTVEDICLYLALPAEPVKNTLKILVATEARGGGKVRVAVDALFGTPTGTKSVREHLFNHLFWYGGNGDVSCADCFAIGQEISVLR